MGPPPSYATITLIIWASADAAGTVCAELSPPCHASPLSVRHVPSCPFMLPGHLNPGSGKYQAVQGVDSVRLYFCHPPGTGMGLGPGLGPIPGPGFLSALSFHLMGTLPSSDPMTSITCASTDSGSTMCSKLFTPNVLPTSPSDMSQVALSNYHGVLPLGRGKTNLVNNCTV